MAERPPKSHAAATGCKTALITGAARRVGRAVALELAAAGYGVALHYNRSAEQAAATVQQLVAQGVRATAIQGDLLDPAVPERLVAAVDQWAGRLDVLVNNAAVFSEMPLEEFDSERWHRCMHINLAAPLLLCRAAATVMHRRRQGCIVNLCDAGTARPWRKYLAYGPSKAGLDYVTRALARELAPAIRVNGVAPGIAVFPEDWSAERRDRQIKRVPLQRSGTPQDIAAAVRFVVESEYITGEIIRVDGGANI